MRRWFTGGNDASPTASISALDEARELQDAMDAAAHMMNDEMELAEAELAKGNSSFHKLGTGLASFMRATLGFEKEFMKIACDRLALAEAAAADDLRKALKHHDPNKPTIYSPGTEYALCIATVQIMYAVVGMMTESLTEAIKGFYKLRKAYYTLERIIQEENKYLASHPDGLPSATVNEPESMESSASELEQSSGSSTEAPPVDTPLSEDSEEEFYDASEDHEASQEELLGYQGRLSSVDTNLRQSLDRLTVTSDQTEQPGKLRRLTSRFSDGPDAEIFAGSVIDGFIHSGASMCYGMLLVLISLMPPSFSTLVKIAGFKGDRIRGIGLLWRATKFHNINGIFASFILLGYYNGLLGFIDILPSAGTGAYPRERCLDLLKSARSRYPKGGLWLLEEARTLAREKKLEAAVKNLEDIPSGGLKQVRALIWFEKSIDYTYLHRDEEASESFLKLLEMNDWSHCLYYYMAGASQIQAYRRLKESDPEKAQKHAEKAEELLKKAPLHIGKKKMIGRALPLDVFINKKVQKWEQRSKEWSVPFCDAVGVSPIEEMTYMWNGYKRMDDTQLNESYARLCWSESAANKVWSKEAVDEKANVGVLKAAILRTKREHDQAKELLRSNVLHLQKSDLEGGLKDNWSLPIAHYEMSVINWQIYTVSNSSADLEECSKWLEKAAHWGSYELDARLGMKVQAARETVKKAREVGRA